MTKTKTPKFPFGIFPKRISDFIQTSAKDLAFSEDYLAIALMSGVSSLVGNRIRYNTTVEGWTESLTFWLGVVGDPSIGKTPAINYMLRPIKKINKDKMMSFREDMGDYIKLSAEQQKSVTEPINKQFILDDTTIEALTQVHEKNGIGVLQLVDELVGWLSGMGQYKSGGNREKSNYLTFWNGKDTSINRVGRKMPLFIENTNINILGGVQSEKLGSFLKEENQSDGFSARLLLTYPEPIVGILTGKKADKVEYGWYEDCINVFNGELSNIQHEDIMYLTPDEEASSLSIEFHNEYTVSMQDKPLNEAFFIGKKRTYIMRFALLLTILEYVFGDKKNNTILDLKVNKTNTENAWLLMEYFHDMQKVIGETFLSSQIMDDVLNHKESKIQKATRLLTSEAYKNDEINRSDIIKKTNIAKGNLSLLIKKLKL